MAILADGHPGPLPYLTLLDMLYDNGQHSDNSGVNRTLPTIGVSAGYWRHISIYSRKRELVENEQAEDMMPSPCMSAASIMDHTNHDEAAMWSKVLVEYNAAVGL